MVNNLRVVRNRIPYELVKDSGWGRALLIFTSAVISWCLFLPSHTVSPSGRIDLRWTATTWAQQNGGSSDEGARLYNSECAGCHQADGRGIKNLFPPLAGDRVVNAKDPTDHIRTVLFGRHGKIIGGVTYRVYMPSWAGQLSDEQIAAVINYERTSWGNDAPTITAEQVARVRREYQGG